jgi:hypothetical protein
VYKTWQDALTYANNLSLCGYSDWRLSNKNELLSLLDFSKISAAHPALSDGHPFINVRFGSYHSATTYFADTARCINVGLDSGIIASSPKIGASAYWPVRGGQSGGAVKIPRTGQTACYNEAGGAIACPGTGQDGDIKAGVPWPNPRFDTTYCNASGPCADQGADCDADPSSDIITDRLTGLVWTRETDNGNGIFQQALAAANGFSLCGRSDWRIPNALELESLHNAGKDTLTWLGANDFVNGSAWFYWTSTTFEAEPSQAYSAYLGNSASWGQLGKGDKTGSWIIWLVRGGR